MIYGLTTKATDWTERSVNDWRMRLARILLFFIPRANPDIEPLLPRVKTWALELTEEGWPEREVGLDSNGNALFAIPDDRNTGFWTDMAYDQFNPAELSPLTAEDFETLWKSAPKAGA